MIEMLVYALIAEGLSCILLHKCTSRVLFETPPSPQLIKVLAAAIPETSPPATAHVSFKCTHACSFNTNLPPKFFAPVSAPPVSPKDPTFTQLNSISNFNACNIQATCRLSSARLISNHAQNAPRNATGIWSVFAFPSMLQVSHSSPPSLGSRLMFFGTGLLSSSIQRCYQHNLCSQQLRESQYICFHAEIHTSTVAHLCIMSESMQTN